MGLQKYIFVFFILSTDILMANRFMGILMSQNTEDATIDGYEFKGDNTFSIMYGSKDMFSDSWGGYFTFGGTYNWDTDKEKEKNEKNGDIENVNKYNIYNIGLTYSPIKSITLLGGVGQGNSKGIVYNGTYSNHFYTEKVKETNYNIGLNYSSNVLGLVAMYDSFSKVYSFGITFDYNKPRRVKYRYKKSYKQSSSKSHGGVGSVGELFGELFNYVKPALIGSANVLADYNRKNQPKDKNSLHINVKNGNWISTTVKEFTIQIEGDSSTNYLKMEDSSGNRLFQSGYADFNYIPTGSYKIKATGINTNGSSIFLFNENINVGVGDTYCTIDVKDESISCR